MSRIPIGFLGSHACSSNSLILPSKTQIPKTMRFSHRSPLSQIGLRVYYRSGTSNRHVSCDDLCLPETWLAQLHEHVHHCSFLTIPIVPARSQDDSHQGHW